ncbi:MAG: hypothetical protein Tsb0020_03790 [Haliangiales bacterium]
MQAFQGPGTAEQVVYRVLNQPPAVVRAIARAYDADYNQHTGDGLIADLRDEFDSWSGAADWQFVVAQLARAGVAVSGHSVGYHRAQPSLGTEGSASAANTDGAGAASGPPPHRIVAEPDLQVAVPGTAITYRVERADEQPGAASETERRTDRARDTYQWYALNDPITAQALGEPARVEGGVARTCRAAGRFPGNHKIICRVTSRALDTAGAAAERVDFYEFPQTVVPEHKLAADALAATPTAIAPDQQLRVLRAFIEVLEAAEAQPGSAKLDPELKRAYQKQLAALTERLASTAEKARTPIRAVHIDRKDAQVSPLKVFVARMDEGDPGAGGAGGAGAGRPATGSQRWALIDITNPSSRRLSGEYIGVGASAPAAVQAAIAGWDRENRYPPGRIKLEVGSDAFGPARANRPLMGEFATDGASFWDSISEFFAEVGFWSGVGAIGLGVATAIAPVPGSRAVSALVWTSILASTAAASVNIAQRRAEGIAWGRDDAMDTLSIAGNILAGTWMKGAKILVGGRGGSQIATGVLIGQVATDGAQGVLLSVDFLDRYDQIMTIDDPKQRTDGLLELLRSALLAGGMLVLSVKSTRSDLDRLGMSKANIDAARLRDPGQVIDLDAASAAGRAGDEVGAASRAGDEAGAHTASRPGPDGPVLGHTRVALGGEVHTLKLQRWDGTLRVLLCSDCGPVLRAFDDALENLDGHSRLDPSGSGLRVGVGPQKSLYNRLRKLRDTVAKFEAEYRAAKRAPHQVQAKLNQIVTQLDDLKRAFPDFDASCFAGALSKKSTAIAGSGRSKHFIESALTDEFDVAAWERYLNTQVDPGERIGLIRAVAAERARKFGWEPYAKLDRFNRSGVRDIYRDPRSEQLYSVDVQHGRFEWFNNKGKHRDEVDFALKEMNKQDKSGKHDIRTQ